MAAAGVATGSAVALQLCTFAAPFCLGCVGLHFLVAALLSPPNHTAMHSHSLAKKLRARHPQLPMYIIKEEHKHT